jgi:opacity protein-like surface antigen
MINKAIVICVLFPAMLQAQEEIKRSNESGHLSLGMRSTVSLFGSTGSTGIGYGGQFRLRLGQKLNTEWFADYIRTDLNGLGTRNDGHIGWSVMFYPLNPSAETGKLNPYILAGHCFDYTKVSSNLFYDSKQNTYTTSSRHRLSSAMQMGVGTSYNISKNADISLSVQYMTHLGNDIHTKVIPDTDGTGKKLVIDDDEKTLILEGHLFCTLSLNIRIADLWK